MTCLVFTVVLVGCAGRNQPETSKGTVASAAGRVRVSVRWPERPASRLIPAAANSIAVRATSADGTRLIAQGRITRPASGQEGSLTLDSLPTGLVAITATAFPAADGTGVAQATARTQTTITAGQTTDVPLTLASTIDHLEIAAQTVPLNIGQTVQMTAAAKNLAGEVVLTVPDTFTWSSGNTAIATVTLGGLVTAKSVGTAILTAQETESGKSGTGSVTVTATAGTGQMYVSSIYNDSVKIYDVATGAFVREFIPAGGALVRPQAIVFGSDGLVYISCYNSKVSRFNAATGAYVDDFFPSFTGGIDNAVGIIFAKDGTLLICSAFTNDVKKFNGQTGAFISTFLSGNCLAVAHDIIYGPDGNLYVCSSNSHEVKKFDPNNGAFLGNFVTAGSGGLNYPNHIIFGPDGNLYVTSWGTHEVKKYNGTTGAYLGNFVTSQSGNLSFPFGLAFGPDGNLYVASKGNSRVKRYNGQTGSYLGDVDPNNAANLNEPWGITFH